MGAGPRRSSWGRAAGRLVFAAILGGGALAQEAHEPTPPKSADAAWAELRELEERKPPAFPTKRAALEWREQRTRELARRALAFHRDYPDDPRRWSAALLYTRHQPMFYTTIGDNYEADGWKALQFDQAAQEIADALAQQFFTQMAALPDPPPDVAVMVSARALGRTVQALRERIREDQPAEFDRVRQALMRHFERFPDDRLVTGYVMGNYAKAHEAAFPGRMKEEWARFAGSPNRAMAALAEIKLSERSLAGEQVEMVFTAVDGRPVDLAKLRGKVVLIDFWATWCGPCIAELPNLKRVYATYHDKGFEIVGIALENAGLQPDDTPAQTEAKLARSRQVLMEFTAREAMPWPQFFDGKFWKTGFVARYGVGSIPAMLLVDQEGRIVSTNARGPKLEAEVKRLLGL